jgi:hypothetical protein
MVGEKSEDMDGSISSFGNIAKWHQTFGKVGHPRASESAVLETVN